MEVSKVISVNTDANEMKSQFLTLSPFNEIFAKHFISTTEAHRSSRHL